ncbi:hypothetical protein V6N11_009048 [Hibiscus sabdariffa]|uniref:RNase H type-1 domain-containing protein n=1 Tax=Hibiscus sabdariffa TaxID=183260 RepID=A0ABR2PQA2_9ROSI
MTNEGRSRRQFTTDVSCSISGVALESLDHVFLLVLSGISAYNAKVFDAPRVEESSVINRNARLVSMMVQAREECQLMIYELDSMEALQILQADYDSSYPLGGHLSDLRRCAWCVKVQHVLRTDNKVANELATGASLGILELIFYASPPDFMIHVLHEDSLHIVPDISCDS